MPSNPDTRVDFRDKGLVQDLDSYAGRGQRHHWAKACLHRYQFLIASTLSEMPLSEFQLVKALAKIQRIEIDRSLPSSIEVIKSRLLLDLMQSKSSLLPVFQQLTSLEWMALVDLSDRLDPSQPIAHQIEEMGFL